MSTHDNGKVTARAAPLILVVDDEFDIATTYSMLFEYHGYVVQTAANGIEALACAAAKTPDIVVSDLMMPLMDGVALCLAWRAQPLTRPIPFILMSAGRLGQDVSAPYDVFLRKPVHFDVLLREVRKLTGLDAPAGADPA